MLHRKREKKRRKEDEVSRESFLRSCVGYFFFFPLCLPLTLPLFETKTQADFERRADPKSSEAAALLEEMRAHVKRVRESFPPQRAFSFPPFFLAASPQELRLKPPLFLVSSSLSPSSLFLLLLSSRQLEALRRDEDPRLSFSTPEFKEAQRVFTDGFKVRERKREGVFPLFFRKFIFLFLPLL